MAPATAGVLAHRPAQIALERFGAVAREEGTDRLRRPLERDVVRVDLHFGEHCGDIADEADALQSVADRLLQHETDRAFRLCDGYVQRLRRNLRRRLFGLYEDVADLRPVAVHDDELVAS